MNASTATHPPRQERSRRTLARLLAATVWTLDEVGLDEATIPRIAAQAGVSPATIYRRFDNKQALLRAAFLHMLERSNRANREFLGEKLANQSLEQAVRALIDGFFDQFRRHSGLYRALDRFMEAEENADFVTAADAIEEANLEQIVEAMLVHRADIRHPDPEQAVRIATLTASTAIRAITSRPDAIWRVVQPNPAHALADELARAYVAYLTGEH